MTAVPTRWEVPVLDVHDREEILVVVVAERQVVVLGPPGNAFTVPHGSVELLCSAVRMADGVAVRQRHGEQS